MSTMIANKYIRRLIKAACFTIGCALALSVFTSCEDDFENLPVEQFTRDFVFSATDSMGVQARQFLTTIYSTLPNGHNRVGGDYLAAATDDAISSALTESDVDRLLQGRYTSSSRVGSEMTWAEHYEAIRMTNTFITNIDVVPLMETFRDGIRLNAAWKSEARFIRAFHYFQLLKRYGGVPIMGDQPAGLDDNLELPRNTFEECVNYIVAEMDAIEDSLRTYPIPDLTINAHIVTSEAAMALKSRVLLYAASPLFNGGNIGTNEAERSLVGYPDYDAQRWERAAIAASEFITEYGANFSLNPDFTDIFITDGNPEIIFFRQGGQNTNIENINGPVGFSAQNQGNGRTSPSQNLVEAFPMLDGKPINDPTSAYAYAPNDPYINRDPRLGYTVLYNNATWLNVPVETFEGGKDKPVGATQKTKTGYYMRKFMGDFENQASYSSVRHNWIEFRYAEILLNYAEAQNEFAGPSAEVEQVLFDIRARAGIEPGADSRYGIPTGLDKDEMRSIIQNERRIELAFEGHRYWDIRRWKLAEELFQENNPINGAVIVKSGPAFNFNIVPVATPEFEEKMYLYPIPYSEVLNNSNMIQNPYW